MKKGLFTFLILIFVAVVFFLGTKFLINDINDKSSIVIKESEIIDEDLNETTTKKLIEEASDKIQVSEQENNTTEYVTKPITKADFYLYKKGSDNLGYYTYREDGQLISIADETTYYYDENGLIQTGEDLYFGKVVFSYEFIDNCYIGTAMIKSREGAYLRYIYDNEYRLLKTEQINNSSVVYSYEYYYDYYGNIQKIIEKDEFGKTVKLFDSFGNAVSEHTYNSYGDLIEISEYDADGKLCNHIEWAGSEIYRYSEIKKEGNKYIEYIYDIDSSDSSSESEGLPTSSYVYYIEREYDSYGNLIVETHYRAPNKESYKEKYEYRLKQIR